MLKELRVTDLRQKVDGCSYSEVKGWEHLRQLSLMIVFFASTACVNEVQARSPRDLSAEDAFCLVVAGVAVVNERS